MNLFLIDAIGPFFSGYHAKRINWSKIPFKHLAADGALKEDRSNRLVRDFERFLDCVSAIGYNAVTLDDLAHLTDCAFYPSTLRAAIADYQRLFRRLLHSATARDMKVFITSDIMFYNDELLRRVGTRPARVGGFLAGATRSLFRNFPDVSGMIFRIGESDGLDVAEAFRSRLVIRSPRQARRIIQALLPAFEQHGRLLIFRTWSVGAYGIGDLIWNRDTYRKVFSGIDSELFVISMKYGESDFFRYLPFNKQFYRSDHKKIIELQARREYEGFGEFPSFVGWDYQRYRDLLASVNNCIGIQTWCQTGGWTRFRRLTYLENSSVWNEINTYVTLRLFKDGVRCEQAIADYAATYMRPGQAPHLERLLRLSDEVVKELLYIEDFARRKLFFRRLRIPGLLSVYWDHVLVNHSMRKFLRCFVEDGEAAIRQGWAALDKIRDMQRIAREAELPDDGLAFQYATFEILAMAREYYFRPYDRETGRRLGQLKQAYRQRFDSRYSIHLDFNRVRMKRWMMQALLTLLFREQRGYRMVDRIITIRLLGILYPLVRRLRLGWVPAFAREQAMGIDAVFK
jgi:hypothetical protein